ncbi:MAG: hypothetical protein HY344_05065 [Candidatus Levybacteria bacterium]|nr:hypothetical protein [Candidatus Levybacteria bacterium]
MDKSQEKEEKSQDQQQKSAIDRLNQAAQKARQGKTAIETAKKGAKLAKKASKKLAGRAATALGRQTVATIGAAIVSTAPAWGPPVLFALAIGGLFLVVIIIIIVLFSGATPPPTCKTISADPTTISNNLGANLSVSECSENITYSWALPQIGGVFSASQSASTLYTPPQVNSSQKISIAISICSISAPSNCSQYQTPELTVVAQKLYSCNGYCTIASSCPSSDITGQGTCPTSPSMICCKKDNKKPGPVPSCSEIDQRLRQDYRIRTQSGTPPISYWGPSTAENISCATKQGLWKIFSILTKSWSFENRLLSTSATIQFFYDSSDPTHGYGLTAWAYRMQLHNATYRINNNLSLAGAWITHETGHWLQKRDGSLEARFPDLSRLNRLDSGCYEPGSGSYWLKTYSLRGGNISPIRESMAEAISLYVYNEKYNIINGRLVSIVNFKIKCPNTYKWVRDNIFRGYEYN